MNIFQHCSVLSAWPCAGAEYTEERDRLRTVTMNVFWALYFGPDSILSAPSGWIFLISQLADLLQRWQDLLSEIQARPEVTQ